MSAASASFRENLEDVIQSSCNGTPAAIRKTCLSLAHLAELADRHDDMCLFMNQVVKACKNDEDLTLEERSTLSVAYKNAVGARRAAWRTLQAETEVTENNPVAPILRKAVERELEELCREVLRLLEDNLIVHPNATVDSQIFYLKMAGDYYRYLAEFIDSDELNDIQKKSADFYRRAMEIAEKTLPPTDPIRLGLALNYSVCLYEIVKDRDAACALATEAFDLAVHQLDDLDEEQFKDGALILQLLRDNLALWGAPGVSEGAN